MCGGFLKARGGSHSFFAVTHWKRQPDPESEEIHSLIHRRESAGLTAYVHQRKARTHSLIAEQQFAVDAAFCTGLTAACGSESFDRTGGLNVGPRLYRTLNGCGFGRDRIEHLVEFASDRERLTRIDAEEIFKLEHTQFGRSFRTLAQCADAIQFDRLHILLERRPPAFCNLRGDKIYVVLCESKGLFSELQLQYRSKNFGKLIPNFGREDALLLCRGKASDLELFFRDADPCRSTSAEFERQAAFDHKTAISSAELPCPTHIEGWIRTRSSLPQQCLAGFNFGANRGQFRVVLKCTIDGLFDGQPIDGVDETRGLRSLAEGVRPEQKCDCE